MPTYEYKCKTCGREFEFIQRITEPALTHCPNDVCTHSPKGLGLVERKISKNIGLVFNGSGFYLTDYVHKHGNFNGGSKHNETIESTATSIESKPKEITTPSNVKTSSDNSKPV
jgi:putative FmdB family regulatory protein